MADTDSGFIKIHRKMLDWEWFGDGNVFKLFMYCLLKANHKEGRWRGNVIKRGEFISSIGKMASACMLSTQQLRTSLDKLNKTGELTSEPTNKYTLVRVNKYSTYHDYERKSNKQTNKQITNEITNTATNKQQTNNNQITNNQQTNNNKQEVILSYDSITNKNEKNEKNEKKEEKAVLFDSLWKDYPKKDGRKAAERHFNASVNTDQEKKDIRQALTNYLKEINGTDMQYVKNGSTFFNNWKDKIECNDVQKAQTKRTEPFRNTFSA